MATRRRRGEQRESDEEGGAASVRSFWSGTISFGLVSIPVDLLSAVRPRQTSMKLVDKQGHALGRQYHCSKDGKKLRSEDLVRGYETDSGETVVITDEELESVAPEMSRDIELRRFVPLQQIPPMYYQRPYFLAPAGRSAKAYNLLATTMERTQRVAIGVFVMRGHEYLVAILSENGVLRAETLRYADELRTPEYVGLPQRKKAPARQVGVFVKDIEALAKKELDMSELEDREAEALQELVLAKQKRGEDVIERADFAAEEGEEGGAQVIDLMQVLKERLSKSAVVTTAEGATNGARTARTSRRPIREHRSRKSTTAGARAKRGRDGLAQSSKSELYKIASELDLPGRSKMGKKELLEAIRRTG